MNFNIWFKINIFKSISSLKVLFLRGCPKRFLFWHQCCLLTSSLFSCLHVYLVYAWSRRSELSTSICAVSLKWYPGSAIHESKPFGSQVNNQINKDESWIGIQNCYNMSIRSLTMCIQHPSSILGSIEYNLDLICKLRYCKTGIALLDFLGREEIPSLHKVLSNVMNALSWTPFGPSAHAIQNWQATSIIASVYWYF